MDAREVLTHLTTPLTAPPYPAVLNNRSRQELFKTGRFVDREYLNIYYRTDPEALRRFAEQVAKQYLAAPPMAALKGGVQ